MNVLRKLRAKLRLLFGVCPACNSDAPELDTCQICYGFRWSDNEGHPPSLTTKQLWYERYRAALAAKDNYGNKPNTK